MAFSGLLALLDDIATIADDVATLTVAATRKASGIVTDDMAVTAEQAIGIRRDREIPVVLAVARGSMKNKAFYLAPGALALNAAAPWSIGPLLMAGGTFLAFEGVEKVIHAFKPHDDDHDGVEDEAEMDPEAFEQMRVEGAIRTDFILSGEIIALTLGEVASAPFISQVATLYAVSAVMVVGVYGLVAALVRMDDFGEAMAARGGAMATVGNGIVAAAPRVLKAISAIGTLAMMGVGGHIVSEGIPAVHHAVAHTIEQLPHAAHGVAEFAASIGVGAVVGLIAWAVVQTGIPGRLWAMLPTSSAK